MLVNKNNTIDKINTGREIFNKFKELLALIIVYRHIIFFLSLCMILYFFIYKHQPNFFLYFKTLLMGTNPLIKELTSTSYLWFLPTLVSTLILIMIYNSLDANSKKYFLFFMLITHLFITVLDDNTLFHFPLGSVISFYLFIIGIIIHYKFYNHLSILYKYKCIIFILFFVSLFFYHGSRYWFTIIDLPNFTKIQDLLLLVFAFFSILFLVVDLEINVIKWVDERSFVFYTIHPLVIFALNYSHKWNGISEGILKISLTISLIAIIAYMLEVMNLIYLSKIKMAYCFV